MATIYNRGSKKQPNYTIVYDDFDENGSRQRKFIKRPEKAAVGPENGLPEPSVDLGAVRPGGADPRSSQA